MALKSAQSRPRARGTQVAVATSVVMILVTAFVVIDISGEAEPSWLEARVASSLLQIKLRLSRPTKASPLMPTEQDLERGSELYQQQCGICHGVARGKMAPLATALSPRPPQFVIQPAQRPTWMDVYVIQHGVRWSGMPAFRGLSEADAWRLALYVEGRNEPKER